MTNVKQAQSAVMARTGDAMVVDAFTKGSSSGASKGTGKSKDSEVVCWNSEKKRHLASDGRKKQREPRQRTVKKFKERRQQTEKQQERVQRQVPQLWQDRSHAEGLQIQRNECFRS